MISAFFTCPAEARGAAELETRDASLCLPNTLAPDQRMFGSRLEGRRLKLLIVVDVSARSKTSA